MNQSSISQNFISLQKGELSRKWGFGRKVQKGHTKGHKGQGQFGLADENVAYDPKVTSCQVIHFYLSVHNFMTERLHYRPNLVLKLLTDSATEAHL